MLFFCNKVILCITLLPALSSQQLLFLIENRTLPNKDLKKLYCFKRCNDVLFPQGGAVGLQEELILHFRVWKANQI